MCGGLSLWDVRADELFFLVRMLLKEPASWLHAVIAGWANPVSREWMATVDLYDMQLATKSRRKQKEYPRPWASNTVKIGGKKSAQRTPAEVMAILRPQQ